MGTLTKQIYRYTHPRSMRHNENLWPYVKIQRDNFGAISSFIYKNNHVPLQDLTSIKESYHGDVLLIATGPSINKIDFSHPPTMPTVGVNGAWHLNNYLDFNIYIIVDMVFIDKKPEILKEVLAKSNLILFTTVHGIIKLIEKFSLKNIHCKLAVIEDKCFQVFKPKILNKDIEKEFKDSADVFFSKQKNGIAFNNDIRSGVFDAGTVIYWALQILAYLGFQRIFIAGLDMTNFSSPRFYESSSNMLPSYLANKLHDIILPAFELASLTLRQSDIEVINLSLESAIPGNIFPKMDYRDACK